VAGSALAPDPQRHRARRPVDYPEYFGI